MRSLVLALGPDWRWLRGEARGVTVLLHPSGLHALVSDVVLLEAEEAAARAIAGALGAALAEGVTGEVDVELSRDGDEYSARAARVAS